MSKIKLNWISGKRLLERWNLEVRELHLCIQSSLPVYNPNFELEEWGPIYTEVPNPDYNPNDILSEKYTITKNNLHDFQVLLDSPFPVKDTGLTKDQILNNLLFKLEDVENYEKEYRQNNKEIKRDKEKKSEFAIFDSIVNGELRPFLEIYSSENHIKSLMEKLWSVSFLKTEEGFQDASKQDESLLEILVKPGDKLEFEFDETDPHQKPKLSIIRSEKLEELIDIDIPPPPDFKAEYFLDLIELEYKKIKFRANKVLETSSNKDQIDIFANKNIQRLKVIAGQAHTLSRRLKPKDKRKDPLDDSDSYIILVLKIYIIRSILFYQRLFQPFLKVPFQDEFELRTSLYGERHPKDILRMWDEKHRDTLYKELAIEIQTLKKSDDKKLVKFKSYGTGSI